MWKFVVFIKELLLKIIFVLKNWNKNYFLKEIFCVLYKYKLLKFCGNVIFLYDVKNNIYILGFVILCVFNVI